MCGTPASETTGQQTSPSPQQELPTKLLQSGGGKKAIIRTGPPAASEVKVQLAGKLGSNGAGCITIEEKGGDDWTLVF
jgi:hypothetical protein